MRLTIGKKLNSLIIFLLLLGIGSTVVFALGVYTDNIRGLLEKSTLDSSSILARNVQSEMRHIAEWARTLGSASLEQFRYSEDRIRFIQDNLKVDSKTISIALYTENEPKSKQFYLPFKPEWRILDPNSAKKHRLTDASYKKLDVDFPLDLEGAKNGRVDFAVAKFEDGTPVVRMVLPFVRKTNGQFSRILVTELAQEKLTSIFTELTGGTSYLVDRKGVVLGSSNPSLVPVGRNLSKLLIVTERLKSTDQNKMMTFRDLAGETQIGSYHHVGFADLTVVSQIPERLAKSHQAQIARRSGFLAAAFLFLALTFGFMFSKSLTNPIRELEKAASAVRDGDFTIRLYPKGEFESGDEIQRFSETFNDMVAGLKERDHLKNTFSKFHSQEVANKILSGEVALGGERRSATVFFSDIRGFTRASEKLEAETLVLILNRYMSRMVRIISDHGGVVDKFIGDAILAVWGVPIAKPDDPVKAVRAALAMRQELAELNEELIRDGLPTIKIGMGLNYGPVVAGNIGSEERMEYTVIGDTVNTASRIESLTKTLGKDLLISQDLLNEVSGRFTIKKAHDSVRLKGKIEKIAVYTVSGYVDESGREVPVETNYSSFAQNAGSAEKSAEGAKPKVISSKKQKSVNVARNPADLPEPEEYATRVDMKRPEPEALDLNEFKKKDDKKPGDGESAA